MSAGGPLETNTARTARWRLGGDSDVEYKSEGMVHHGLGMGSEGVLHGLSITCCVKYYYHTWIIVSLYNSCYLRQDQSHRDGWFPVLALLENCSSADVLPRRDQTQSKLLADVLVLGRKGFYIIQQLQ